MTMTRLGALRVVDRGAWEARVRELLQGRTIAQAADMGGVSARTMQAWVTELGLGRGLAWRAAPPGVLGV